MSIVNCKFLSKELRTVKKLLSLSTVPLQSTNVSSLKRNQERNSGKLILASKTLKSTHIVLDMLLTTLGSSK